MAQDMVSQKKSGKNQLEKATRASEDKKKGRGFWTVVTLALVYLILPIDIIPESMFGPAGLLDDAVVLAYLIKRILGRFRN